MFFWINKNQVVGISNNWVEPEHCPSEFVLVEGPYLPVEDVFFDGKSVVQKPEIPGENYYWDGANNKWSAMPVSADITATSTAPSQPTKPREDWIGLTTALQTSAEWAKAYSASEKTLKANTAFTSLSIVLTATRLTTGLETSFAKLREAMGSISGVGDFSASELKNLNQMLKNNGFSLVLS